MSEQVQLHDDDKLQLPGDVGTWRPVRELRALGYTEPELSNIADFGAVERRGAWYTVRELHTLEGRRNSAGDLAHIDAAKTAAEAIRGHAIEAIDHLGALRRAPSVEKEKRFGASAAYPIPDSYAAPIAAIRAASSTPESTFEEQYKAERLAALASEPARVAALRAAHGIPEPRLVALAADDLCKSPDVYGPDLQRLRERDARQLAAKESR